LEGSELGGGGSMAYQAQGGPAFSAYAFRPGGQLL
jgi:hypothetical protein